MFAINPCMLSRQALVPVSSIPSRSRKLICRSASSNGVKVVNRGIQDAGHFAMVQGLGQIGEVDATHLPWILRLAHIRSTENGDSSTAMDESAIGLTVWRKALDRGLLPDDETLKQLIHERELFLTDLGIGDLQWPCEPLRETLTRGLAKLGVARFAKKYPGVQETLLLSIIQSVCQYYKIVLEIPDEEQEVETDATGNQYISWKDIKQKEAEQRAARLAQEIPDSMQKSNKKTKQPKKDPLAGLPIEKRAAILVTKELYQKWEKPINALEKVHHRGPILELNVFFAKKAGRAFEGLESLLGGGRSGVFELTGNMWSRKGWTQMDELRRKLENLKELRDLVRSLGRGGGWGPLRRAPIQFLDMKGRDGLLRTILEQQETRGLTRSDDISRLLPGEAALIARGRQLRQAKLLFFSKLAEKSLSTYERDGWGEFPTNIIPERREIRPTADRGPILLCVDTSGSMQGPRETVAKALTLECMRAAREQERNCFVFAFSGPREVRELELNQDMKSVNNLLDFLERVFNGGSDFNEPVKRCLDRLTEAKWANSDILLVSDGELRQPGTEIMRKLSGAKEKLGLRVHGLIVGTPEKQRSDPAVLRSLCTNYLPNGKTEIRIQEFEGWTSVKQDEQLVFDWDDLEGDSRRRIRNLEREKQRQEEIKRKRREVQKAKRAKKASARKH